MTYNYKAFRGVGGQNGNYGVEDFHGAVLYEAEFSEAQARAIADYLNHNEFIDAETLFAKLPQFGNGLLDNGG